MIKEIHISNKAYGDEVWKHVKGFEGIYKISSYGRLKSFKRIKNGYVLSNVDKSNGYLSIVLENYKNKKIRYTRIHRLVAETFIPNPYHKLEVNHKDCNKQNNNIENLEWVTAKENIAHAIKNTNMLKGMNNYNKFLRPKIIQQYSIKGKFIAQFFNAVEAMEHTGICNRNILQVASKDEYKPGLTRKQAGGYIWKFK